MDNPIWNVEDGIGHLVLNDPPTNRMNRFFFLNSSASPTRSFPGPAFQASSYTAPAGIFHRAPTWMTS